MDDEDEDEFVADEKPFGEFKLYKEEAWKWLLLLVLLLLILFKWDCDGKLEFDDDEENASYSKCGVRLISLLK